MAYTQNIALFDGSSGQSSTQTTNAWGVADFNTISFSWLTVGTAGSILTLQGSNEDGVLASIGTWSNLSRVVLAGAYNVAPGVRWVRFQRTSDESTARVVVQAKQQR